MSEELSPFPPDHPAPAVIETQTFCSSCGYNLHLAPLDGKCPECGTDVARSLQGDRLANADPQWVAKLRTAVTLMLVNALLTFIVSLFVSSAPRSAIALVSAVAGTVTFAAMWLLTTPEPKAWRAEQTLTIRMALRICAVVNFAATLIGAANVVAPNLTLALLTDSLQILGLASFWLFFLFLSRIARRIPSPSLSTQCKIIMWGFTASMFLVIVMLIARAAAARGAAPALSQAIAVFACPAALGILVFAIWMLIVLLRLRTALATAAAQAQQTAAAPQPL